MLKIHTAPSASSVPAHRCEECKQDKYSPFTVVIGVGKYGEAHEKKVCLSCRTMLVLSQTKNPKITNKNRPITTPPSIPKGIYTIQDGQRFLKVSYAYLLTRLLELGLGQIEQRRTGQCGRPRRLVTDKELLAVWATLKDPSIRAGIQRKRPPKAPKQKMKQVCGD